MHLLHNNNTVCLHVHVCTFMCVCVLTEGAALGVMIQFYAVPTDADMTFPGKFPIKTKCSFLTMHTGLVIN